MRSAILLFALALVAPPATFAASYERQSEAIKQRQQLDAKDDGLFFFDCMKSRGFVFCKDCQQFGYMLGGVCVNRPEGADRPACWYPKGEKPISLTRDVLARWEAWVKNHG